MKLKLIREGVSKIEGQVNAFLRDLPNGDIISVETFYIDGKVSVFIWLRATR